MHSKNKPFVSCLNEVERSVRRHVFVHLLSEQPLELQKPVFVSEKQRLKKIIKTNENVTKQSEQTETDRRARSFSRATAMFI